MWQKEELKRLGGGGWRRGPFFIYKYGLFLFLWTLVHVLFSSPVSRLALGVLKIMRFLTLRTCFGAPHRPTEDVNERVPARIANLLALESMVPNASFTR